MRIEYVQAKGTMFVPSGRFTNVWTAHGYSRLPEHLTRAQVERELTRLGFWV